MNISLSLQQRFEFNNLPRNEALAHIQEMIYHHTFRPLYLYTRRAFVLQGYRKLCLGEIGLDEFFRLGDIENDISTISTRLLLESCFEIEELYNKHPEYLRDAIVVVEQGAKLYYEANGADYLALEQKCKNIGASMCIGIS